MGEKVTVSTNNTKTRKSKKLFTISKKSDYFFLVRRNEKDTIEKI